MAARSSSSAPLRAAALGAISGVRTFTAPGVLAARGRWGGGAISRILPLIALGEYAADKTPVIPPRSELPSLLGRVLSGTACGAAVAGSQGAGMGAACAAATTLGSQRLRAIVGERTGVPDPLLGLAEDAVVLGVAALVSQGVDEEPTPTGGSPDPGAEAAGSPAARNGHPAGATSADQTGETGEAGDVAAAESPRRLSPVGAVLRGVVAAAVGTAAMTTAQSTYMELTGASSSDVPEEMARRISEGVLKRRLPRRHRDKANQGMHLVYGTSWGVPLGLVVGSLRRRPPALVMGGALGVTAWAASLVALPALKLSPPPWEQSPAALAADLSLHLVYGASTGAVYAGLIA